MARPVGEGRQPAITPIERQGQQPAMTATDSGLPPGAVTARLVMHDELASIPDLAPVIEPDTEPPDYSAMDGPELRAAEPDIVATLFDADQRTKRQVGRVDVTRLIVPQHDLVKGSWVYRRHTDEPHLEWFSEENGWRKVSGEACQGTRGAIVEGPWNYRVRGLMPEMFEKADVKASRKVVNNAGMQTGTRRDTQLYNAMIVWLATVPEDRAKPGGWDDPKMIDKYQVANGIEVVQEILLMGELLQAVAVILHLSRFTQQTEELLGN